MNAHCCPTCGQTTAALPIARVLDAPLTRAERRMVEVLVQKYPTPIPITALVEAVYYDDASGGPDDPEQVVRVFIGRLRRKLPAYGWTVPRSKSGPGNYGSYRLQPSGD